MRVGRLSAPWTDNGPPIIDIVDVDAIRAVFPLSNVRVLGGPVVDPECQTCRTGAQITIPDARGLPTTTGPIYFRCPDCGGLMRATVHE